MFDRHLHLPWVTLKCLGALCDITKRFRHLTENSPRLATSPWRSKRRFPKICVGNLTAATELRRGGRPRVTCRPPAERSAGVSPRPAKMKASLSAAAASEKVINAAHFPSIRPPACSPSHRGLSSRTCSRSVHPPPSRRSAA